MQQVPTESSKQVQQSTSPLAPTTSTQDGFHQHDPSGLSQTRAERSRSQSPRSVSGHGHRSESPLECGPGQLEERLYRLSIGSRSGDNNVAPGQRVSDYENALTPPTIKQAMGFRVIKRQGSRLDGTQLEDFPNGESYLAHLPLSATC